METDLPYLEPLLFWLRSDETLKQFFTEKSFFMPHSDMVSGIKDLIEKSCPVRALWIQPQDTLAATNRPGCNNPGNHTFYITLIVPCIRNQFELFKTSASEIKLGGQFMELIKIRKAVKKSVHNFYIDSQKNPSPKFNNMVWRKDQMLYPSGDEDVGFLATAIQFDVTIF